VVKSCKFLYVCKYVVTLWLLWLKINHIEYRCTTINMHKLNMLPDDNIPNPMMRSIFKSTNIKLANDEHSTNITNLHKQVNKRKINQTNILNIEQIITSSLINYGNININWHEYIKNALYNLNNHQYLSWLMNTTIQPYYHAYFPICSLLELVFLK